MNKKLISLLLSITIIFNIPMPRTTAYAVDRSNSNSGMVINKTATDNGDGTYTVQLEAYATGSKVITEVSEDVPTDIILVIDQSGSMSYNFTNVSNSYKSYGQRTNSANYENRHNDNTPGWYDNDNRNLWYKVDDVYYSVSVKRIATIGYNQIFGQTNSYYRQNSNNLYSDNAGTEKVNVTYEFNNGLVYTYTFADGSTFTSKGYQTVPDFGDKGPLYLASVTDYTYTYTYTDTNDATQTIGTSIGANTTFTTEFYQKTSTTGGTEPRLDALIRALNNFVSSVNEKAAGPDGELSTTEDNVNHRIAIVGFSSDGFNNTELLTGVTLTTKNMIDDNNTSYYPTGKAINGVQYGKITPAQYQNALQSMDTVTGRTSVTNAINALTAHGGTQTDDGMAMANEILANNPVVSGEKRNRVVIVFTDGIPTGSGSSYNTLVADEAIEYAATAKNTTTGYGATVYAVGIFNGADAADAGSIENGSTDANKGNNFLQRLSSNNGTPQTPSYYLSASDSGALQSIFQQIADQIESGGSFTTLTEEAIIKDIIAPQFTLPEGATEDSITLETYSCKGIDASGNYDWEKNENDMGATASVNDDKVSVSGFNFAENYVGTVTDASGNVTYRGDKLVISFKVEVKEGFLGGNNIYTNTSAGVYENINSENPLLIFERPQVNVPIKEVIVTAQDKNVYLLDSLSGDELKSSMTVKVGDVQLNLNSNATNYGLADWQTSGVDITVKMKDNEGNEITNLNNLVEDKIYTIAVTVSPKTDGTGAAGTRAIDQSNYGVTNINVFKPELTFQDSEVYYGDKAPDNFNDNQTKKEWKHGETVANTTQMGQAPDLTLTYTPDNGKISNGMINTKEDIGVNVAVLLGTTDVTEMTNFIHTGCTGSCSWVEPAVKGKPVFLLHVKTCSLTIEKTGEVVDEPYVFDIYKDNGTEVYTQATIVGKGEITIYELPVGVYTIQEDTGWSWRYNANYGDDVGEDLTETPNVVSLTKESPNGSITCTNDANDKIYWLNGYSNIVNNTYGKPHTDTN